MNSGMQKTQQNGYKWRRTDTATNQWNPIGHMNRKNVSNNT
jgi:hypothetical protein